jgi:hypothetical protein
MGCIITNNMINVWSVCHWCCRHPSKLAQPSCIINTMTAPVWPWSLFPHGSQHTVFMHKSIEKCMKFYDKARHSWHQECAWGLPQCLQIIQVHSDLDEVSLLCWPLHKSSSPYLSHGIHWSLCCPWSYFCQWVPNKRHSVQPWVCLPFPLVSWYLTTVPHRANLSFSATNV